MTDPSVGQVDDADDIIASLNAMLMEEKRLREAAEQHLSGVLQIMNAAENALKEQLKERRRLKDELHASTREAWTLHDRLKEEQEARRNVEGWFEELKRAYRELLNLRGKQ